MWAGTHEKQESWINTANKVLKEDSKENEMDRIRSENIRVTVEQGSIIDKIDNVQLK